MPLYDPDTNMCILCGKGDRTMQFVEVSINRNQRCCRGGAGGVVCVVLIFEKRPLYLVLKGSKNFACGFKTTFFQKFLLKPHPNPFLLRFCVLKCGFNQICSKKCIFGPKIPYFFKIFGAFGAETCGFNPIFCTTPCGSAPAPTATLVYFITRIRRGKKALK